MTALSKDLAAQINEQHRLAYGKAQEALEHARAAGELLIKAKDGMKHGEWLPWLAANVEVSERQSQKYIAVAKNWTAITSKSALGADLTLNGALDALAKSRPKPERPKSEPASDLPPAKPVADLPEEIADEPKEPELVALRSAHSELIQQAEETQADLDSLILVVESDDKLVAALAEAKRYREMNRILEERIRGLQNEKNEAIRQAKMWQRKYEQATRAAA